MKNKWFVEDTFGDNPFKTIINADSKLEVLLKIINKIGSVDEQFVNELFTKITEDFEIIIIDLNNVEEE